MSWSTVATNTSYLAPTRLSSRTEPRPTDGIPTGQGDWRIAVQAILPSQYGAVVGDAVVGRTAVAEATWLDLPDVTSVVIDIGAQAFGAQREVGTCVISLSSTDFRYSQWMRGAAYQGSGRRFRPGLGIRVITFDPSDVSSVEPLFVGEVETWRSAVQTAGTHEIVEITCVETFARLGWTQLEGFYVPDADKSRTLLGAPFATVTDVFHGILDEVSWPWGATYSNGTNYQVSPYLGDVRDADPEEDRYTGSALLLARRNLTAEYLALDSNRWGELDAYLHRPLEANGRYVVNGITPGTGGGGNPTPPVFEFDEDDIQPDSLVVSSVPDAVLNARGDYRVQPSIDWFGLRYATDIPFNFFSDNPDPTPAWTDEQELQAIRTEVDFRAFLVDQIEPITFTNRRFMDVFREAWPNDTYELSCFIPNAGRTLTASGAVRRVRRVITPRVADASISWETTLTLDTYSLEGA